MEENCLENGQELFLALVCRKYGCGKWNQKWEEVNRNVTSAKLLFKSHVRLLKITAKIGQQLITLNEDKQLVTTEMCDDDDSISE